MSRIGRLPVKIPTGVTITLEEGNVVAVKGPKGSLSARIHRDMQIENQEGVLTVSRPSDNKLHRSLHGLSRTLISNMVIGVTEGYQKTLEMSGIGYRAQLAGNKLTLLVGYSHPVEMTAPQGITFEVPAQTRIVVRGIDKQLVGEVSANIRAVRKPEPYMGYGIRYENEVIRRKEGKAGKK